MSEVILAQSAQPSNSQPTHKPSATHFEIILYTKRTRLSRNVETLAAFFEQHRAGPKAIGGSNASKLAFLLTLKDDARDSVYAHPELHEVACTHGWQFDLDKVTREQMADILQRVRDAGYAAVFWFSHSSTKEEPCGRLLVLADSGIDPVSHRITYAALRSELCPEANTSAQLNQNRGFNPPRGDVQILIAGRALVDWRAVLARAPAEARREISRAGVGGAPGAGADWSAPLATNEKIGRERVLACPAAVRGQSGQSALMKAIGTARAWGMRLDWREEEGDAIGPAVDAVREWDALKNGDDSWFAPECAGELWRKFGQSNRVHGEAAMKIQEGAPALGIADGLIPIAGAGFTAAGEPAAQLWNPDYKRDAVPTTARRQDFADKEGEALVKFATERQKIWLEYFNARHYVLQNQGGKCVIAWWVPSDVDPTVRQISLQSPAQFHLANAPYTDAIDLTWAREKGEKKSTPKLDYAATSGWWFRSRDRNQARGLVFRPDQDEREIEGQLNMWTGFPVRPAPAGPELERWFEFVRDVIADRNAAHADYIFRWIAWTFQHRGEPSGVAVVLRGGKGYGKNSLWDPVRDLWGVHGITVTRPEHVTGKFNAHLADKCFLFLNEAVAAADKPAESAMKGLITDPTLAIERKGHDVEPYKNSLNLAVATNEKWAVPATEGERRFAVFDVSAKRKNDFEYWRKLHAEALDKPGFKAQLLGWALGFELGDWHPRKHVPQTAALAEQIFHSMRGAKRDVAQMLLSGAVRGNIGPVQADGRVFVGTAQLCEELSKSRSLDVTALALELARCCPPSPDGKPAKSAQHQYLATRARGHWLPPLTEARACWAAATGLDIEWPETEGGWMPVSGWVGGE